MPLEDACEPCRSEKRFFFLFILDYLKKIYENWKAKFAGKIIMTTSPKELSDRKFQNYCRIKAKKADTCDERKQKTLFDFYAALCSLLHNPLKFIDIVFFYEVPNNYWLIRFLIKHND